jgi:hypothetical protein
MFFGTEFYDAMREGNAISTIIITVDRLYGISKLCHHLFCVILYRINEQGHKLINAQPAKEIGVSKPLTELLCKG